MVPFWSFEDVLNVKIVNTTKTLNDCDKQRIGIDRLDNIDEIIASSHGRSLGDAYGETIDIFDLTEFDEIESIKFAKYQRI